MSKVKKVPQKDGQQSKRSDWPTRRKRIRSTLPYVSAVVSAIIITGVFYADFSSGPHYLLPSKSFNELTKAAMDIRLDQAKDMFQIGLAVIGLLWGLLIAKKEEAVLVLEDRPELFMSISATLLLIFSSVCHLVYLNTVTSIYISAGTVAGKKLMQTAKVVKTWIISDSTLTEGNMNVDDILNIPDIFDSGVNYLFIGQWAFLAAGIINAVLTFISAHKLKPDS